MECECCHGEGSYDAGDIDGVAGERFCDECEKGQALSDEAYAYHRRLYYPGAGRSLESIEQDLRDAGETNKANMIAAQRGAQ